MPRKNVVSLSLSLSLSLSNIRTKRRYLESFSKHAHISVYKLGEYKLALSYVCAHISCALGFIVWVVFFHAEIWAILAHFCFTVWDSELRFVNWVICAVIVRSFEMRSFWSILAHFLTQTIKNLALHLSGISKTRILMIECRNKYFHQAFGLIDWINKYFFFKFQ